MRVKKAQAKEVVLERDGNRCTVCGTKGSKKNPLTMHHVKYRRNGGTNDPDNLVTLCKTCHELWHKQNG
jgi:5-methylcytosine-specific restriction endonuclease McrA